MPSKPETKRPTRGLLVPFLLALPLVSACERARAPVPEPPYSALLVTLDTTRADALSPYGNRPEVTPHLSALAEESVLYERAHTVTPVTLPSHTSMLTGLYPPRHTVRDNGLWPLPQSADTLAERAAARGFRTAAFLAAVVLDATFGLDQGFERYDTPTQKWSDGSTHYAERPANEVVDEALEWLASLEEDEPFFLWVHLFDAHGPHEAPDGFQEGLFAKNPYFGEIAFTDAQLDRLLGVLQESGRLPSTYVAVVADHGEAFGENGEWSHGAFCYESTMRVPLLLRDPMGARAGERSRETVSVVDLYPTLSEAMGIPVSTSVDGKSLFRTVLPEDRGIYFESYIGYVSFGWSPLAGWLQGTRKYLHSSDPELFDLSMDTSEARNLYSARKEEVTAYQAEIRALYQREALQREEVGANAGALTESLRNLGYAAMGSTTLEMPDPLEPSSLPSPQSMTVAHQITLEGMALNNAGLLHAAEKKFREAIDGYPNNYFAMHLLGFCLLRQNREAEAIPILRDLLASGPRWPDAFSNLGTCLAKTGDLEGAENAFRSALALDPGKREALMGLSQVLKKTDRPEEAAEWRAKFEALKNGG